MPRNLKEQPIHKPPSVNAVYRRPELLIATWFGCGLLRPAPGTWGSLAAFPLGIVVYILAGPWGVLGAAGLVLVVGLAAIHMMRTESQSCADLDRNYIVIDEVVGQLIAMIPAALSPALLIASFVLFRLFDIWKPTPISQLERFPGGASSVMLDDVAAGIAAAAGVLALSWIDTTYVT